MEDRPSFYANIPAPVRYNKELQMGARMMYGEITALCNQKGFCWAGNKYFADLYEVTEKTISRWIKALESNGYIIINYQYATGTKRIEKRCISIALDLSMRVDNNVQQWGQKSPQVVTKMSVGGDKKVKENTTYNTTSNNTSVITQIILSNQTTYEVTKEEAKQFQSTYKNIDVEYELNKMATWCWNNVEKRKTPRGIKRFINGWLSNADERAINKGSENNGTNKDAPDVGTYL